MSVKLAVSYRDRVSTVMSIKIFEIPAVTVAYRDRVSTIMSIKTFEIPAVTVPYSDRNWYGQFPLAIVIRKALKMRERNVY